MPELRRDPILDRWVIVSSERINRPSDFRHRREVRPSGGFCPFCEGNEHTTPPEILAERAAGASPDTPGWTLRVVPNKFPALTTEGERSVSGEGLYRSMSGTGTHEVVIETQEHERSLASLPPEGVESVLRAYRRRLLDLEKDRRLEYVLIFKNHGPAAGATLEHPHSQIISLPVVPSHVREELEGSLKHFRASGQCIYCDMILEERKQGKRVVAENDHFIVIAPFASPASFETWILPKRHSSRFDAFPELYGSLGELLVDLLRRMVHLLDDPDYNFIIHTSPLREEDSPHYHWHIEVRPTLNQVAGFEWGSGFYINPTPPERAASFLREAGEG
jgi:UDPglucose--hexose-1-phosphate uridylyltransferase